MNKPLNPSAGNSIKTIRDIGGVLNWVSYTRAVLVVAHAIPSCAQVRFLPALPGFTAAQCVLFYSLFSALGFLFLTTFFDYTRKDMTLNATPITCIENPAIRSLVPIFSASIACPCIPYI